jgi:acyl-CoA thioesterase
MKDRDQKFLDVPANRYLGFQLISLSAGCARISMEVMQEQLQETGVLHGGIISALADTAAVYALCPDLEPTRTMTSIEFKINFLNAALPGKGTVTAESKVLKRGKRTGVCEVEVSQAGILVAKGIFTYLFFERS